MSTPAAKVTARPGHRTPKPRFRYLGEERVIPVQSGRRMIGYVKGEAVVDANGNDLPFRSIGELR